MVTGTAIASVRVAYDTNRDRRATITAVRVHLIDGTYELFRQHFGLPAEVRSSEGTNAAVRGVLRSTLDLVEQGATHIGIATDHVIESFRNDMWPGYKTSEGIDPVLLAQFPVLEDALRAAGFAVFAMTELEADDALASVAAIADDDERVEQVAILTPDKDLAQCVRDGRVVQVDRRNRVVIDEAGVIAKFGVLPESIPDYLALVGDSADGFPGLPQWGAKSAAAVLRRYVHLEDIPDFHGKWEVTVRGAANLNATLREMWDHALLFRDLATLRIDRSLVADVDELRWRGATPAFANLAPTIDSAALVERARQLTPT